MKAIDIIARDHRAAEALFEKFKAAPKEDKMSVERELFKALRVHELMEDVHFYPVLRDRIRYNEILEEVDRDQTTLKLKVTGAHPAKTGTDTEEIEKIMEQVLAHAKKRKRTYSP